jgi:formylglycine-generating enzyme required for sulfatase activity
MVANALAGDTNIVPSSAISGTNDDGGPVIPGDHYTNTVDMELVKVGDYWAGVNLVTQKQYAKVMGSNPSAFSGDDRPVDSVSWNDAMSFCAKLTDDEIKDKKLPEGYYYTIPTESEWENLMAGADLKDSVTSQGTRRQGTAPVGSLAPNGLGLYDTRGNLMEFCLGDTSKPYRVLRGGSWADWIEVNLRPDFRYYAPPDEKKNVYGFRCLLKKTVASGPS